VRWKNSHNKAFKSDSQRLAVSVQGWARVYGVMPVTTNK